MNSILEFLTGMDKMSDQVIATDFLISTKTAIRNYAAAITETSSQDVKSVLRQQLNDAVTAHGMIIEYMIKNGYYQAYNMEEQFMHDMDTTEKALSLANTIS